MQTPVEKDNRVLIFLSNSYIYKLLLQEAIGDHRLVKHCGMMNQENG